MSITIEGKTIRETEENILAAADEIRLRRRLLAEGCSCDLYSANAWDGRCSDLVIHCTSRKVHVPAHVSVSDVDHTAGSIANPPMGVRINTSIGRVGTGTLTVNAPTALVLKRKLDEWLREQTERLVVTPMAAPANAGVVNWHSPTTPEAIGQG